MKNLRLLKALAGLPEIRPSRLVLEELRRSRWIDVGGEITATGREALRHAAVQAEAESAASLGDHNAAMERANDAAAEKHLQRAQRYLDIANLLRVQLAPGPCPPQPESRKKPPTYQDAISWISRYDLPRAFSRSNLQVIPTVAMTAALWNVTTEQIVASLNELRGAEFFLCGDRVVHRSLHEGRTVHVDLGRVERQTALIASVPEWINRFEQCPHDWIFDDDTLDSAQKWLEQQGFTVTRAQDDYTFARDLSRHG